MDTTARDFQKWWESLTTKAKKAITRRRARKEEKTAARAALRASGITGYCCPKCWTWHPTPDARRTCRESHREAA